VVVAVRRVRGIALRIPDQRDQVPVDRHRHGPGRGGDRLELVERRQPERVRLVDAEGPHAVLGQLTLQPLAVRALGEPEAAGPAVPEAALVRAHAGADLQPQPGVGGQQREHCVGGRARPELHRAAQAEVAECGQEAAIELHEGAISLPVVARRAAHLGRQRVLAGRLQPLRVLDVDGRADLAQEPEVPLAGLALERLELVAEDGRQPDGHRRAAKRTQERQVHACHRLPQPFLAEGPGAEALHVGHVAVEDERERPALRAPRAAHRRTAWKSSARSSGPGRNAKSRSPIAGMKRS